MKNLKNVSSGTWVRLVLLLAVLIADTLSALGITPASDNRICTVIMTVSTVLVSLTSYWKNNSFTEAAQEADKFMQALKDSKKGE